MIVFDWAKPTALLIGRYQPFHDGHKALAIEAINRTGQVCIAVRNMPRDPQNPFSYYEVRQRIEHRLHEYRGKFEVIRLPNVEVVFYGRTPGWRVEEIVLDADLQAISATKIREEMRTNGTAQG